MEKVYHGWLKDRDNSYYAPRTLSNLIFTSDGRKYDELVNKNFTTIINHVNLKPGLRVTDKQYQLKLKLIPIDIKSKEVFDAIDRKKYYYDTNGVYQSIDEYSPDITQYYVNNSAFVTANVGSEIFNDINDRTYMILDEDELCTGNIATGIYSHAEGSGTTASGNRSHAEGWSTISEGNNSHAEGKKTLATGNGSHAEGYNTIAAGQQAHAEGKYSEASGDCSHAEGAFTIAYDAAHAEGVASFAKYMGAHAEGMTTQALNLSSHAEGSDTTASGMSSHAEGNGTVAVGHQQHVQGRYNIEDEDYAHIIGNGTSDDNRSNAHTVDWQGNVWYAGNYYWGENHDPILTMPSEERYVIERPYLAVEDLVKSKEEFLQLQQKEGTLYKYVWETDSYEEATVDDIEDSGSHQTVYHSYATEYLSNSGKGQSFNSMNNTSRGIYSHAEGDYTAAKGDYSHAEGKRTYAAGEAAHTEGNNTEAKGINSHAEGYKTRAKGDYSHSEGYRTEAQGKYSHSEGRGIIAPYDAQHAEGKYNKTMPNCAHVVGNGTDHKNRSNAYTLDWNGNAWFAGDVYVHSSSGTNKDAGSVRLATMDDVKSGGAAATITGAASTIVASNLSTNRVLVSNANGKVAASTTTATELGYLNGVTSKIQTQFNDTQAKINAKPGKASNTSEIFNDMRERVYKDPDTTATWIEFEHAIEGNVASGGYSHAEGRGTTASGSESHAEGQWTSALGPNSHSEGLATSADQANGAHSEGVRTFAGCREDEWIPELIFGPHAEGSYTDARGTGAHAEGSHTIASGTGTHAEGYQTVANGNYSHAEGHYTKAYGTSSHAEGYYTTASGVYSHAEGSWTQAEGTCSHAAGHYAKASGNYSTAQGGTIVTDFIPISATDTELIVQLNGQQPAQLLTHSDVGCWILFYSTWYKVIDIEERDSTQKHYAFTLEEPIENLADEMDNIQIVFSTVASAFAAFASGSGNITAGPNSITVGAYNLAEGDCSAAFGFSNVALVNNQFVCGKHNKVVQDPSLFVVGNGASVRANAFRVSSAGAIYSSGTYNTTGADYAEYFEWLDGNIHKENRRGHFVTLDGEKIKIATSQDDYILGIVSTCAAIIGDSYEDQWCNMYLTDQYGQILTEEVIDENGVITIQPIINPDYNPNEHYIPRSQRAEWSAIGMMGKLIVQDDGTCQVNGYCSVNDDGIATASNHGYRVMNRIDNNLIKILFK